MSTTRRALISLAAAALALTAVSTQAADMTYTATLNGAAQLPEATASKAEGTLRLTVSADGRQIEYQLTVTKLSNASGADIHLGSAFANGPLVVKMFPKQGGAQKKGEFSGVLAEGTITADDLTGPLAGGGLADFIDQLKQGNVYTNVHTNDGVDPPESGPGDYRLGEIRGQLK
jgi:hypothetical protein